MVITGNIDVCAPGKLSGWVVCRQAPETRLELEVLCGGQLIGRCSADMYRKDLENAGIGDGRCGYFFHLPADMPRAALRSIRLRLAGSNVFLLQSGTQPEDDELMPVFHHLSRFGGLWIDRMDWVDRLGRRTRSGALSDEASLRIMSFVRDGHVVLRGAVAPDTVDALNAAIDGQWNAPAPGLTMRAERYAGADILCGAGFEGRAAGDALVDAHLVLPELQRALAAPPMLAFLAAIFGAAPVLAGSAARLCAAPRPFIQDSVLQADSENVLAMATAWLALDDARPGDGSPVLLTGSHRARDFLFGSAGKLLSDGPEQRGAYAAWMGQQAAANDYTRYLPDLRAGDVLIRHADLLHGSEPKAGVPPARGVAARFTPTAI